MKSFEEIPLLRFNITICRSSHLCWTILMVQICNSQVVEEQKANHTKLANELRVLQVVALDGFEMDIDGKQ